MDMRVVFVWVGMALILLFSYGLVLLPLMQRDVLPKDLAGLIVLAAIALLIWLGVKLTRRVRA